MQYNRDWLKRIDTKMDKSVFSARITITPDQKKQLLADHRLKDEIIFVSPSVLRWGRLIVINKPHTEKRRPITADEALRLRSRL